MYGPEKYLVPFRGGSLEVWSDTPPGKLAIIAHLSLADPKLDAFYKAVGVELKDPEGKMVFPVPRKVETPDRPIEPSSDEEVEVFNSLFRTGG